MRAWRSIGKFRGGSLFSTWLYRICVNAAHDHRSRRRPDPVEPTDTDADPRDRFADEQLSGELQRALALARGAPARHRRPLRRPRRVLRGDRRDHEVDRGYGEVAPLPRPRRAGAATAGNTGSRGRVEVKMAKGHPQRHDLLDYVEGSLDTADRSELKQHLDSCAACRELVADAEAGKRLLAASPPLELSQSRADAIVAALDAPAPRPERRRPAWRFAVVVAVALAIAVPLSYVALQGGGGDDSASSGAAADTGAAEGARTPAGRRQAAAQPLRRNRPSSRSCGASRPRRLLSLVRCGPRATRRRSRPTPSS